MTQKKRRKKMMQSIRSCVLPLAMLTGGVFYGFFSRFSTAIPYFIFTMLLLTFCKLAPKDVKFKKLHLWLILIQILGSIAVYLIVSLFDTVTAQGAFICVLAPTAMAAAVITGMLGGNVAFLTSYVLVSNIGTALAAPVIFSFMGPNTEMPFTDSFIYICREVMPLLILPLLAAWTIRAAAPPLHRALLKINPVTFYLWAFSLTIVTGRTVKFLSEQQNPDYTTEISLAAIALAICLAQFKAGKYIGNRYGERIAAGQGLGQKNTILAIWMSQMYLNPVASVGPASYVLWQNIVNSYQLWIKKNRDDKCASSHEARKK